MNGLSRAEREFADAATSATLRDDMQRLRRQRHNPFVKDGVVDVDAYIEFVTQFNEFVGHRPKPFKRMIDKEMFL